MEAVMEELLVWEAMAYLEAKQDSNQSEQFSSLIAIPD